MALGGPEQGWARSACNTCAHCPVPLVCNFLVLLGWRRGQNHANRTRTQYSQCPSVGLPTTMRAHVYQSLSAPLELASSGGRRDVPHPFNLESTQISSQLESGRVTLSITHVWRRTHGRRIRPKKQQLQPWSPRQLGAPAAGRHPGRHGCGAMPRATPLALCWSKNPACILGKQARVS